MEQMTLIMGIELSEDNREAWEATAKGDQE